MFSIITLNRAVDTEIYKAMTTLEMEYGVIAKKQFVLSLKEYYNVMVTANKKRDTYKLIRADIHEVLSDVINSVSCTNCWDTGVVTESSDFGQTETTLKCYCNHNEEDSEEEK